MKDWKSIEMPELMVRNCKLDKRGFPIPYVVLIDSSGQSHFKVNDSTKTFKCIEKNLCSICGTNLYHDKWMIGGPASAFHKYGAYVDTPVHYECGKYALQVCPYLGYSGYHANIDLEKLQKQITDKVELYNHTVDNNRVPLFVFTQISKYEISQNGMIVPERPYLMTEFWNDGERLIVHEAWQIVRKYFEERNYGQENLI